MMMINNFIQSRILNDDDQQLGSTVRTYTCAHVHRRLHAYGLPQINNAGTSNGVYIGDSPMYNQGTVV